MLIEFLSNPQKSLDFSGNHASARDFADKYQYDQHLKWAYDKINEQVAHFNYRRKSKEYEKLNQDNIKAVKGALNKEIRSFLDVLDDEWKEEPRKVTPELVVFLASNNVASGSNLTFESWKGFPSGSLHASLAHANRNFDFSQAC